MIFAGELPLPSHWPFRTINSDLTDSDLLNLAVAPVINTGYRFKVFHGIKLNVAVIAASSIPAVYGMYKYFKVIFTEGAGKNGSTVAVSFDKFVNPNSEMQFKLLF